MSIRLPHLGKLGESFAVPSCTLASHFHTLRTIESLTFFHTSIVMTEASYWNWFGVNNGGIHANGFSCDQYIYCVT